MTAKERIRNLYNSSAVFVSATKQSNLEKSYKDTIQLIRDVIDKKLDYFIVLGKYGDYEISLCIYFKTRTEYKWILEQAKKYNQESVLVLHNKKYKLVYLDTNKKEYLNTLRICKNLPDDYFSIYENIIFKFE